MNDNDFYDYWVGAIDGRRTGLYVAVLVAILVGPGCFAQGDTSGGGASAGSGGNPQPVIAEPVTEKAELPVLSEAELEALKRTSDKALLSQARLSFAWEDVYWESVNHYQALVNRGGPGASQARAELAMAYLSRGRFDSAIAVLEKGQSESSDAGLPSRESAVLTTAKNVKLFLTVARNLLREDGLDVTYPDERIFLYALANTPPEQDYLLLSLADTYVAEFPTSLVALNRLVDINTQYALSPPQPAKTPELRREKARFRAQAVLGRLRKLDENDPEPTIRILKHYLLFHTPGEPFRVPGSELRTGSVKHWMFHPEKHHSLTDRQKALLHYVKTLELLTDDLGWENRIAGELADWMDEAATLDPETKFYARLAASLRADKDKINDTMQALSKKKSEESRKLAQRYFPSGNSKSPTKFEQQEQLRWAIFNGAYGLIVEGMRKDNPNDPLTREMTDFMDQLGCTACWGTGRFVPWDKSGSAACKICGGDGKRKK